MAIHGTDLNRRARRANALFLLFLDAFLFLPAWSLHYWQAWAYWLVVAVATVSMTRYFVKHDPKLVERRLAAGPRAEKEKVQKIIMAAVSTSMILLFVVPGIDHRLQWSAAPPVVVMVADLGVVLGYLIIFLVLKENSYASATIEIGADQPVISTGLYGIVRHPMYSGALVLFGCTPLALGSYWSLLLVIPLVAVLAWRLIEEERFLSRHLPGYSDYCRTISYRLIPLVW